MEKTFSFRQYTTETLIFRYSLDIEAANYEEALEFLKLHEQGDNLLPQGWILERQVDTVSVDKRTFMYIGIRVDGLVTPNEQEIDI